MAPAPTSTSETTAAESQVLDTTTPVGRAPESIAGIADAALPSVVSISTATGSGSGFIITDDGYIITNNHVIADSGGRGVQVALQDGRTVEADLIGTSPAYDLAVLDVDLTGLTPLALGDSDEVVVGDPVVAVGSPLGLDGTVTSGIVSATNRPVSAGGQGETSFISADPDRCGHQPGQLRRPVVGCAGSSRRRQLLDRRAQLLRRTGRLHRPRLRHPHQPDPRDRRADHRRRRGLVPGDRRHPADGPGQRRGRHRRGRPWRAGSQAGLRSGDRVVSINGAPVRGSDELIVAIRTKQPGDTVGLSFIRGEQEETVEITLGSRVG